MNSIDSMRPKRWVPVPEDGRRLSRPARWLASLALSAIALAGSQVAWAGGARHDLLRDQKLTGMDYRQLTVRNAEQCLTACAVEGRCRAWTLRPAQRNRTYDNGDDGPTCFLKSGIPQDRKSVV